MCSHVWSGLIRIVSAWLSAVPIYMARGACVSLWLSGRASFDDLKGNKEMDSSSLSHRTNLGAGVIYKDPAEGSWMNGSIHAFVCTLAM